MISFSHLGAIQSSVSGSGQLLFGGQVSQVPPNAIPLPPTTTTIPASPVKNPSRASGFPITASSSFSSFSPLGLSAKASSQEPPDHHHHQEQQQPTLPWPFPPGLSLALPPPPPQAQLANGPQHQFPPARSSSPPPMDRPRLIRSHSVMGKLLHCF